MLNKSFETVGEFVEYVAEHITEYLPASLKDAEIHFDQVTKNNDTKRIALNISRSNDRICPILYMDGFYDMLQETGDIQLVMKEIINTRVNAAMPENMEQAVEHFMNYEWAKDHLMLKTCEFETNQGRLKDAVYAKLGDFAGVVYLEISEVGNGLCSSLVTKNNLSCWQVDEETVIRDALHCNRLKKVQFTGLEEVLYGNRCDLDDCIDLEESPNMMYMLTNNFTCNGASVMFNPEAMDKVGELIGDHYYIIPSSIHELLVIPYNPEYDPADFNEMIGAVNKNEVESEDVLSYNLQYYDMETHTVNRVK